MAQNLLPQPCCWHKERESCYYDPTFLSLLMFTTIQGLMGWLEVQLLPSDENTQALTELLKKVWGAPTDRVRNPL